jgi:uncharacterized protein
MDVEIFCKKKLLCKAAYVTSPLGKARGMMFRLRPIPLLFVCEKEEFIPLHMWFVFFPIDVLYLDKEKRVVEVVKDFLPFMAHIPIKRAKYVLELPTKSALVPLGTILTFSG